MTEKVSLLEIKKDKFLENYKSLCNINYIKPVETIQSEWHRKLIKKTGEIMKNFIVPPKTPKICSNNEIIDLSLANKNQKNVKNNFFIKGYL